MILVLRKDKIALIALVFVLTITFISINIGPGFNAL